MVTNRSSSGNRATRRQRGARQRTTRTSNGSLILAHRFDALLPGSCYLVNPPAQKIHKGV
jgi:hypothetical protein